MEEHLNATDEERSARKDWYWIPLAFVLVIVVWLLWMYMDRTGEGPGSVDGDTSAITTDLVKAGPTRPTRVLEFELPVEPISSPVPDMTGWRQDVAERTLRALGFVPVILEEYSEELLVGKVIAQTPEPGSRPGRGTRVSITISLGPRPLLEVVVPDVVGMNEAEAIAAVQAAGLVPRVLRQHGPFPDWTVYEQEIEPGTVVYERTVIDLLVALPR